MADIGKYINRNVESTKGFLNGISDALNRASKLIATGPTQSERSSLINAARVNTPNKVGVKKNTNTRPISSTAGTINQEPKNVANVSKEAAKNIEAYFPSETIFRDDDNTLWIVIEGRYVESISSNIREDINADVKSWERGIKFSSDKGIVTFNFLAPNELTEVVSHDWQPYDSLGSRIAEKAGALGRAGAELESIAKQIGVNTANKSMTDIVTETAKSGAELIKNASIDNTYKKVVGMAKAGQKADMYLYRVDAPLAYKTSARRIYEFIFQLFVTGDSVGEGGAHPYNQVVWPVKMLQYMSSPGLPNDAKTGQPAIAQVSSPAIFRIKTKPEGLFNVPRAVLKNINPIYRGPYVYGVPSSCELHLTFEEFDPLWNATFSDNYVGLVTTSSSKTSASIK